MKPARILMPLLLITAFFVFAGAGKQENWEQLFNGKDLTGWDTYIGPDLNDSGKFITGQPIDDRQVILRRPFRTAEFIPSQSRQEQAPALLAVPLW